jgi:hypothetical protein
MEFTPSGEVALFVDDNQFHSGESVDKCGPEAVALFWHSVAPGQHNPYSSADIHAMAHADYVKFIGPDNPSDQNGTSDQNLYNMLNEHNFHYEVGPLDITWVKEQLNGGVPVIIGIVESSVIDNGIGAAPYAWNTTGLTHVLVASGPGAGGEILVRDTANIAPTGVRPGPRHYDANRLQLVSATAVHPSWITNPPEPPPPDPNADAIAAWSAGGSPRAPFVAGHGIPDSYAEHFHSGHYFGQPVEQERNIDVGGVTHAIQAFTCAQADWNAKDNKTSWSTPSGVA